MAPLESGFEFNDSQVEREFKEIIDSLLQYSQVKAAIRPFISQLQNASSDQIGQLGLYVMQGSPDPGLGRLLQTSASAAYHIVNKVFSGRLQSTFDEGTVSLSEPEKIEMLSKLWEYAVEKVESN